MKNKCILSMLLLIIAIVTFYSPYSSESNSHYGWYSSSKSTSIHVLTDDFKEKSGVISDLSLLSIFIPSILPFLKRQKNKFWIAGYFAASLFAGFLFYVMRWMMNFMIFSEVRYFPAFYLAYALSIGASVYLFYLALQPTMLLYRQKKSL